MRNIIIAIDGYSSTGKSTLAKQLARKLGHLYIDSGAMYRAITLFALKNKLVDQNGLINIPALIEQLPNILITCEFNPFEGRTDMYLNGENVEKEIRSMEVSNYVSDIATISEVRQKLVTLQRTLGEKRGVVMDGRDIGTVVFPKAELKIFLTAAPEIRAQRRYNELLAKRETVQFEEVLKNLQQRDYIDSHRQDSPLIQAPDAVLLDNSNMSVETQLEYVYQYARPLIEGKEDGKPKI